MPRLVADGLTLAASPDGTWIALGDPPHVSLHHVESQHPAATYDLPSLGPTDLGFMSDPSRLWLVTRAATGTVVTVLGVPELEPLGTRELPGHWHARAFVGERCLLGSADGTGFQLLTSVPPVIAAAPMPLRPPLRFAAPASEDRFLLDGRQQLEVWEAPTRRLMFRLSLPLPPSPRQAGFAHASRLLWVADASGRLDVYRFSDGRRQLQIDLGAGVEAIDGVPDSSRLIAARRTVPGGAVELTLVDLARRQRWPLAVEGPLVAFCLVPGARGAVATATAQGELTITPLPEPSGPVMPMVAVAPESVAPPEEPSAAPPASETAGAVRDEEVAARVSAWRSRIRRSEAGASGGDIAAAEPPGETAAVKEGQGTSSELRDPAAPAPFINVSTERRPLARTSRPDGPERPPHAEPAAPPPTSMTAMRPAQAETAPAAADTSEPPWRDALVGWGEAVLAREPAEPPAIERGTSLSILVQHLELSPLAARTLTLLYAGWLLGLGERGLPSATIARALGEPAGWSEALGRGQLATAGLVTRRHGRLRLRAAAARLLDGCAPRCPIFRPAEESTATHPIARPHRLSIDGEPDGDTLGRALARRLGALVVVIDLRALAAPASRSALDRGLLEARILGAIPLVLGAPAALAPHLMTRLGTRPALVSPAGSLPPLLEQLPVLTWAPASATAPS